MGREAVRLCGWLGGRGRVASCGACEWLYSWIGGLHVLLLFYVHVAGLEFNGYIVVIQPDGDAG
jgi:hypothetical protein